MTKKYISKKVKIKRTGTGAGLALYADESVKKGEFIAEYWGEILTRKQADERGGRYLFETSANRVIDGTSRANKARYINHGCKPNAEIDIRQGRVLVFAWKNIKSGEEITYDYGKEYFDEFLKPMGCRCKSCMEK